MNKQHQQDWKELNEWLCEPDGTEKDFCSTSDLWFGASLAFALRRILDRIRELERQRDAALKLADKWANRAAKELGYEVHGEREIRIDEDACCADELRAIFETKEQAFVLGLMSTSKRPDAGNLFLKRKLKICL